MTCFKRRQFLEKELIYSVEIKDIRNSRDEYMTFTTINCDTLVGEALYIGMEMTLDAENVPFRSRLVASVDRANGSEKENLSAEFVQLDWLKPKFKGEENNVVHGALISSVPENGETLSMFLWNPDKTPFSIRNGKCYLYCLNRDF